MLRRGTVRRPWGRRNARCPGHRIGYGQSLNPLTYPSDTRWRFTALRSGIEKVGQLGLSWEVNGDPISDDYVPNEITARELLERWLRWVWDRKPFDADLGVPHVPIYWFVHGADSGTFEAAPPIIPLNQRENFTTFYSRPTDEQTGEPINWLRLPVEDKLWRVDRSDKGGFIQEATGFKPSAFQPALDLPVLDAAGVDWGDRST